MALRLYCLTLTLGLIMLIMSTRIYLIISPFTQPPILPRETDRVILRETFGLCNLNSSPSWLGQAKVGSQILALLFGNNEYINMRSTFTRPNYFIVACLINGANLVSDFPQTFAARRNISYI